MSFWAPALEFPAENGIPKKSLDTSMLQERTQIISWWKQGLLAERFAEPVSKVKATNRSFTKYLRFVFILSLISSLAVSPKPVALFKKDTI